MATLGNPLGGGTDPFGNSSTWARQWAGGGQGGWSGAYGGPANTLPPGYGMTPGLFGGYGGFTPGGYGGTPTAPTAPGGAWWSPPTGTAGTPPAGLANQWQQAYAPGTTPGMMAQAPASEQWGGGTGVPQMPDWMAQPRTTTPPADYAAWLKEHPGANAPDPGGGTVGSGGASAPAAAAAPPPPPQAGQPGANLFSGYDDLGQLYWNQNPGQAWAHAWSQLGPNVASPYWNWGMQQQSRYNDQYLAQAALPNQANLTFTDFINQHAPGFANEFQNLPASQRGVTNQFLAAGRMG